MHKTNGNMSGQHRKENKGQKYTIFPKTSKQFQYLRKKSNQPDGLKEMTCDELKVWLNDCQTCVDWNGGLGRRRNIRREWVDALMEVNQELEKRINATL